MRAVLMVGGRGVRLRPYTSTIPKPLVPLGGECPILEVLLRQLRAHDVEHVTLAIGHLGHLIRSYVGDGSAFGLTVDYWEDRAPLGTIGPLLDHVDELPEHVLVLNGDLLCDLDFTELFRFHLDRGADLTLAASCRAIDVEFGVLEVDGSRLSAFREKPRLEYLANMGIYVLARRTLESYEPGTPLGVDDVVADHLAAGRSPAVYAFDGYWLDIGRPEDYDRANAEFATLRASLLRGPAEPAGPVPAPAVDEVVIDLRDDSSATSGSRAPVSTGTVR